MEIIKISNLLVRFLLELCVLVIFSYWGFTSSDQTLIRILLGIGSPVLFAIIWGTFISPKAFRRLQEPWRGLLEIILFVLAAWALYSTGKMALVIAFIAVYIINKVLMLIWKQ